MTAIAHVRVRSRGRITIPKPVREAFGLNDGDILKMEAIDGRQWIRRIGVDLDDDANSPSYFGEGDDDGRQ